MPESANGVEAAHAARIPHPPLGDTIQKQHSPNFLHRMAVHWLVLCLGLSFLALIAQLMPDAIRVWREWPRAGQQVPSRAMFSLSAGSAVELRYLLYLPQDYSSKAAWPLLIFLHGTGERGADLDLLKRSGLPAMLAHGKQLPMIVASPQCPADSDWKNDQLLAFVDQLQTRFAIDSRQIFVAGYSMGGCGAWSLAAAAPGRFAAIVPVSGVGNAKDAANLSNLPVWAFHGAKDSVVPIEDERNMIEAVRAAGGKPHLTIYPDRDHDACDITFARADLYDWLLRQHRVQ
jgi:predicted peptidase